jgi:hypothetical protein
MPQLTVNILGTLTVGLCAVLLLLAYGRVRNRLLFWSGMCFAGLAVSNALLIYDQLLLPDSNMFPLRLTVAAGSMGLLLYGLIFESDRS